MDELQKVSTAEHDYVKNGFFARTRAEELKCPDLELNELISMEDVTARVLGAVKPEASASRQNEQRKGEMARIEKESTDKTGLRSDVVELYQGGEYWLYRYKKYTDIRLAMAPEVQAAFYGGDPDNFTYPRFDFDMALFRVYEGDKPVHPKHYFRWSKAGAKDGELVFVTGHPGSTRRLDTVAQLEYERDYRLPDRMKRLNHHYKALLAYAARGPEQERRSKDDVFNYANSVKAVTGFVAGLADPKLMAQKAAQERDLRDRVAKDAALAEVYGGAWDRIAAAQKEMARRQHEYAYRRIYGSQLGGLAETVVRYVVEV
jgi:hypothetical protein